MDFLRKTPQVSWHVAGLIIFLAGYLGATITTLAVEDMFGRVVSQLLLVGLNVIIFMTIMFILSYVLKRIDLVDVAWGPAFVVAAVSSYFVSSSSVEVFSIKSLTVVLVIVWAARLTYAMTRRLMRQPEDRRYVEIRKKWKGNKTWHTYIRIFMMQGVLATIISIAVIHINIFDSQPINTIAAIGASIWLIGFGFEVIGDWQLKRFLAASENKGKLMMSGLWKYTRHPNYFGEATMWWGIFVIALGTPYGWVGVITPVVITYLLLWVSGVSMAEKSLEAKAGWKRYKERTSMFVPLLPK